jgi:hypothetical protein
VSFVSCQGDSSPLSIADAPWNPLVFSPRPTGCQPVLDVCLHAERIAPSLLVLIPRTVAISAIVAPTQPGAFGTLVRRQTGALGR